MSMKDILLKKITDLKREIKPTSVFLTLALFLFIGLVFYVNLSCNPDFYHSDMYCDLNYAKEAWKSKTIFPSNWIFGNQTYVFSTPVVAAFLYGVFSNVILSMAIASCVMTILIVISYDWMTKPLFSYNERLTGFLVMVGIIFIRNNIATDQKGAQLFFTMASYYSGYLITAFVVLGCYVRIKSGISIQKNIGTLVISLVLSFCTGMQSIRQTAIMVLPLLACESFFTLKHLIRDKTIINLKSLLYSVTILFSNLLGIFAMNHIRINQKTFWGEPEIEISREVLYKIRLNLNYIFELLQTTFFPYYINLIFAIGVIIFTLFAVLCCLKRTIMHKEATDLYASLFLFYIVSCMILFCIGIFTNINMREIYYFMLFPFIALSAAYFVRNYPSTKRFLYISVNICFILLIAFETIFIAKHNEIGKSKDSFAHQAATYATENGYSCIFAPFGCGTNIAIASNDQISLVYFGNNDNKPLFIPIDYLCVKDSYKHVDNSKVLYYIPKNYRKECNEKATSLGVKCDILIEFDNGSCLCKMSKNICVIANEQNN